MKKFKVISLGCRTNQYESQAYCDQLIKLGYTPASEGEEAQICIVNTCTVTESADSGSRHAIRQIVNEHHPEYLLVTGCFAERDPVAVRSIHGVTHVVSNKDKENLLAVITPQENLPEFSICRFEAHTRAFLKIQDGCNSFCSYCVIPYVRGRSRSRLVVDILQEANALVTQGYKEIVLTGINVGDFEEKNKDSKTRLAGLVRSIDQIPGLARLRISSIDPDEVDDDLLDAVTCGRVTCPSMHIVLQSGSNVILKKMNRKYTRQVFLETVDRLKKANKDFTFTTDVIVGFPGETEADFQETLDVIKEVKFAKVHMFPYSDRPRTRSSLMPNKVTQEVIKERKQELLRLAETCSTQLREAYVGRIVEVLTENREFENDVEIGGYTANFLPVRIQDSELKSNQIIRCKIIKNSENELLATLLSE